MAHIKQVDKRLRASDKVDKAFTPPGTACTHKLMSIRSIREAFIFISISLIVCTLHSIGWRKYSFPPLFNSALCKGHNLHSSALVRGVDIRVLLYAFYLSII